MADNILEVKKLKISFRTNNGTVKAIRDISFELKRGETLAIVGESGSGKSVTSKAILGISAGNAIIDSGEILYDGKDLLKLTEEEMCKIRGDKISMIFQDPLSALNPIVKIGPQIIEALILKNKASRKTARKEFNQKLEVLKQNMYESFNSDQKATIDDLIQAYDNFSIKSLEIETDYNQSHAEATEIISKLEDFLFRASKHQSLNVADYAKTFLNNFEKVTNGFLINNYLDRIATSKAALLELSKADKDNDELTEEQLEKFNELKSLLLEITNQEKPDFLSVAFYMYSNKDADLSKNYNHDTKQMLAEYLQTNFLAKFLSFVEKALINSHNKSIILKQEVLSCLDALKQYFRAGNLDKKEALEKASIAGDLVLKSIDQLDVFKDSLAYTFKDSIIANVKSYFYSAKSNVKEAERFEKQTAKYEALVSKGKHIDWKVVPAKIVDLNDLVENIISKIERLEANYIKEIENKDDFSSFDSSLALIEYFKKKASEVVYKVTKAIAKEQAIKLMEEVGISEPRLRYKQYPFEFSGGMRQRIVIAIALASNPDVLICDEPTTALDVTIQSQILELINKLKKERNLSVIFITHDLGVVANMADRIAVMYAGKIVEYGTSEEVFYSPAHPYTWALLSSMPDLKTTEKLDAIPGTPPNMIYPPVGDAFAARNKYAMKIDFEEQPPLFKITDTHYAATWLLHPDAPKVEMPKIIKDRIERMKQEGGSEDGK